MKRLLLIGSEGYVGRALAPYLQDNYDLDRCDLNWFSPPYGQEGAPAHYRSDYRELKSLSLEKYDAIILLAGHSSVAMCKDDMIGAIRNNVNNFATLVGRLAPSQPLIYASSASVYGNGGAQKQFFEHDPLPEAMNWYDFSKQGIDRIAKLSGKKTYGLRFGTVNGASPNLRTELMLNSMYLSAKNTCTVRANNFTTNRAILGMKDLIKGVGAILYYIGEKGPLNTGVYNLASFNSTIEHMAKTVCDKEGALLQQVPDSPTYSFMLNCQKFQEVFDWAPTETIETILEDLRQNHAKMSEDHRGIYTRNKRVKYE